MATKRSNWLIGCGIGCLVIVGIIVALGVGGAMLVKDSVKGFQAAAGSREELERQHGQPGEFTPRPDGAIPADRMEVFLAVREATQPARLEIARTFASFPMSEEEARKIESQSFFEKMGSVLKIGKSAFGLGSILGGFFEARNNVLLEQDMGMGEYTYIYVLAYYGALEHSPLDSPDDPRIKVDLGDGETAGGRRAHEWGGRRLGERIRRNMIDMLKNQLAALPAEADAAAQGWRGELKAEIDALEDDPLRIPWHDGLPPAISASIDPYLERLERTYNPITNQFELARNRKRGNWSIEAD